MTRGFDMRKTLALMILLCGAASAQAGDSWCVKYTEDGGVSLVKAPGIVYKLKHVRTDQVDTEESEVFATDDGRLSIGFAEGDPYWLNYKTGEQGEVIAECP
jgi:hypothetical protein